MIITFKKTDHMADVDYYIKINTYIIIPMYSFLTVLYFVGANSQDRRGNIHLTWVLMTKN